MWHLLKRLFGLSATVTVVVASFTSKVSAWLLINALLLPAVLYVSIVLHELGHAVACLAVGGSVHRVLVGIGPELWRVTIGRVRVRVNTVPAMGLTYVTGKRRPLTSFQLFLVYLGGPLVTFGLSYGIWFGREGSLSALATALHRGLALGTMLAWLNLYLLIVNLLPIRYSAFSSDGLRLFELLTGTFPRSSDEAIAGELLNALDLITERKLEAAEAEFLRLLSRKPDSALPSYGIALIRIRQGQYKTARDMHRTILSRPDVREEAKLVYEANIAWLNVRLNDESEKEAADIASARAMRKLREDPSLVGIRGSVLRWLGRHDEALPLLEEAYALQSDRDAKCANACELVLTCLGLGLREDARTWYETARGLNPQSPQLEEAALALSSAPSPTR